MSEGAEERKDSMPVVYRSSPDLSYQEKKRRIREAYAWLLDGEDMQPQEEHVGVDDK